MFKFNIHLPRKPKGATEGQWLGFCRDAGAGMSPAGLRHLYGLSEYQVYAWLKKAGISPKAQVERCREEFKRQVQKRAEEID